MRGEVMLHASQGVILFPRRFVGRVGLVCCGPLLLENELAGFGKDQIVPHRAVLDHHLLVALQQVGRPLDRRRVVGLGRVQGFVAHGPDSTRPHSQGPESPP